MDKDNREGLLALFFLSMAAIFFFVHEENKRRRRKVFENYDDIFDISTPSYKNDQANIRRDHISLGKNYAKGLEKVKKDNRTSQLEPVL